MADVIVVGETTEIEKWQLLSLVQVGDIVTVYYPDSKTNGRTCCPRKGEVTKVGDDRLDVETSRGPRTLLEGRIKGTVKILRPLS